MLNAFFECNFDVGGPNHLTAQGPLVLPAHPGRYPHRRWAPRAPAPHPQTADRPWPRPTRKRTRALPTLPATASELRGREREREGERERERRGWGGEAAKSAAHKVPAGSEVRSRGGRGAAGSGAAIWALTPRSAPRRRRQRSTEAPVTPGRRRGGAGIRPARRAAICNGATFCSYLVT